MVFFFSLVGISFKLRPKTVMVFAPCVCLKGEPKGDLGAHGSEAGKQWSDTSQYA